MKNRDLPAADLTGREAAAIAAMQGMLAANKELPAGTNDRNANIFVARNAVSYADALFDALEKKALAGSSTALGRSIDAFLVDLEKKETK